MKGGGNMATEEFYLLEFTGAEWPHCHKMDPLVERLEDEEKIKIAKLEVWHNENQCQTDEGLR